MNAETFFESFDLLAEAPNSVAKLRELILQLAVQGKLVPQDARDKPALAHAADTDVTNTNSVVVLPPIPKSWEYRTLGGICEQVTDGEHATPQRDSAGKVPLVTAKNVRDGFMDLGDTDFVTVDTANSCWARCKPQDGDVLMVCVGATTGRLTVLRKTPEMVIVRSVALYRPISKLINPDYLALALRSPLGQTQIWGSVKQSAQPCLYISRSKALLVPIPPLAEQRRIVSKVDELLGLCDELETRQGARRDLRERLVQAALDQLLASRDPADFATHWGRLQANFDILFDTPDSITRFGQAVRQLAVQGRLVSQDPNDEPAINDLIQIESEKQAIIDARNLRPNRVSEIQQTRALQYEIPTSWRWFRLGDVVFFQEGPGIRNWQFRSEGVKLLNVQNIVNDRLVLDNSDRYVSTDEFEDTYKHFAVETGDILFASSGGSWGKTAWFEDPGYPVMLNTSMIRLKFYTKRCLDDYLILFLRTSLFRKQMEVQLVGMQPNFGSTHLGRVYIPLPPSAEQRRIVSKVNELLSLCDGLKAKLVQAESASAHLLSTAARQFLNAPVVQCPLASEPQPRNSSSSAPIPIPQKRRSSAR